MPTKKLTPKEKLLRLLKKLNACDDGIKLVENTKTFKGAWYKAGYTNRQWLIWRLQIPIPRSGYIGYNCEYASRLRKNEVCLVCFPEIKVSDIKKAHQLVFDFLKKKGLYY